MAGDSSRGDEAIRITKGGNRKEHQIRRINHLRWEGKFNLINRVSSEINLLRAMCRTFLGVNRIMRFNQVSKFLLFRQDNNRPILP